jgi:hypothetical protein
MKATTYENGTDLVSGPGTSVSARQFWYLLRQDAARRSLRWSLPIALLIGLLLRAVAGTDVYDWDRMPLYKYHHELTYMLVQLWLGLLFAIILAHFNSRCSSLSLGLPISARTLWLVRIVAIIGAGILPVATIVLAISLFAGGELFDPALVRIGARIAACIALSVVLFQVPDPGLYRIRGTRAFKWYVAAVTVCLLFYVSVTPGSWLFTILPLLTAVVVMSFVLVRLPSGFRTSAVEKRAKAVFPGRSAAKAGVSRMARWPVSSTAARKWRVIGLILRETVNSWSGWLMLLLIMVNVWALVSQYYAAFHPLNDYIMLMLWIWILLNRSTTRVSRFDSYPLPRRLVFRVVMIVVVVAMGAGFAIGYILYHKTGDPITQVRGAGGHVRVPFEAWEVAWDGQPPEVVSPWGEKHTPGGKCLFGKDTGFCVYSPYEVGKKNSPEFLAFQIDRAVERVHGVDETVPKLVDTGVDSSFVRLFKEDKCMVESSLYRSSELRMRTQAVIVMGWVVLLVILVSVWWRRFRPGADFPRTRWFVIVFFTTPYVIMFGLLVLNARGLVSMDAALALTMISLRWIAESIPLGTNVLYGVTALVVVACLWYVQSCFVRAEATSQCDRKTLLSEY